MGYIAGSAAEIVLLLFLAAVQWQLGRTACGYADRRWPTRRARLLRLGISAAGFAVLLGLILSLPFARVLLLPASLAGWLRGAALLWAFSSSGAWVVYKLLERLHVWRNDFSPGRRALLRAAGGAAVAAPFAFLGFGALVERTAFRVREIDLPVPDLDPDLDGLRLVQLSDIHLSPFLSEPELARVVDAANELRAHVMLVTGDLISTSADPLDACLRQIARLRSDAGTFGCLGNHEVYARATDYTAAQGARLGIPFLRSRARQIRFGSAVVNIAGVDYQKMSLRPHYLDGAERMLVPGALNILLSHNPDLFPVAARQGWDLTLAGHTHGGQVNFEILHQAWNVARFYTPYVYGVYRSGRSSIYVTRGIGTIGMPARLGAPPEIALLRLRKA
jgi:predicted MPP superfamily phosphohydrolase